MNSVSQIGLGPAQSEGIAARVVNAVLWRSGSQIAAQLVMWSSTFIVIRLLAPSDYGLFAMTQLVLSLMSLLTGYSFTASLVQGAEMDRTLSDLATFGYRLRSDANSMARSSSSWAARMSRIA